MTTSRLLRLSGLTLLLGGLLGTAANAFHPMDMINPANVPVHLALYTAVMLIALGLPGLYITQASSDTSPLGLAAYVTLFIGLVFADPIHSVLEFTVVPVLAADPAGRALMGGGPPGLMGPLMVAIPLLLVGLLLTAITSIRAGLLPRWPAVLAILAVIAVAVGFVLSGPPGSSESALSKIGPALVYLSLAGWGYVVAANPSRPDTSAQTRDIERELIAAR